MNTATRETPGLGDNQPNHVQDVIDRLADEYKALEETTAAALEKARQLPVELQDETDLEKLSNQVVDMRDIAARAEATRKAEKEPYLRSGQAVDGFFNGLKERLEKGMRVLTQRANDYQQKKLAAERERRRLEAERQQRIADAERKEAQRKIREAEERRLEAERARKPETIAAKSAVADQLEQQAAEQAAAASAAANAAHAAHIETLKTPAEVARSRFDGGRLATMAQVGHVEIVDKMKLDAATLWPFIKEDHALQALKAWAKTTAFKRPMDGAIVEMRDDTVIR